MLPIIDRCGSTISTSWTALKAGIGLRGYGQKDPRVEYEKEAYEIFEQISKNNIADEADQERSIRAHPDRTQAAPEP